MTQHEELRDILKSEMDRQQKIADGLFSFLDQALIYLSAGGIVLSVTFVKDIVGGGECINNVILLKVTWGLWAATVLSVLLSYRLAQTENHKAIRNVRDLSVDHASGTTDPQSIVDRLNQELTGLNSKWGKWISWFNWMGFTTYILGILSMILFACMNT